MAISTNLEAQRQIDEEIEVHMAEVRRLLKRRNTYSAINQLPDEVLSAFFIAANDWGIVSVLEMASVCSRWRQICLDTPQLWTTISLTYPRWCTELLSRSKECPLTIDLTDNQSLGTNLVRIASHLVPHTSRFADIAICGYDEDFDTLMSLFLRPSFGIPAPRLESVSILFRHGLGKMLEQFWDKLISLRSLRLTGVLPTITSLMPNLVYLRISTWDHGNHLSVPWLIDLFRNTPHIETVDIREVSSASPIVVVGVSPISLARLGSLSISMGSFRELKLFSFLQLPAATTISLIIVPLNDEPSPETNFALLQPLIAQRFSHASPSLDVSVDDRHYSVDTTRLGISVTDGVGNDISHLCIILPTRQLNRVELIGSLPLGKIHKLKIRFPEEALAWSEKIPLFSQLRELHVDTVAFLLSVAVVPSASSEHQSGRFIHGELEKISITWDNRSTGRDWAQFLRVCQSHHKRGKRLQLHISGCDIPISFGKALKAYTELDWDERGSDALVEPFEELPSVNE